MRFFNVKMLMVNSTHTEYCRKKVPISPGETKQILCHPAAIGSILKIYPFSEKQVYLSLCEVQVYGIYGRAMWFDIWNNIAKQHHYHGTIITNAYL